MSLKDIGKKLRDSVFEEDEVPSTPESQPTAPQLKAGAPPLPVQRQAIKLDPLPAERPGVDQAAYEQILSEVDRASSAPYQTFMKQVRSLERIIPDRTQRIQAAFATAGVSKEKLLEAVQSRLSLLETERLQYEKLSGNQTAAEVTSKRQDLEKLTGRLGELREQITALEQQQDQLDQTVKSAEKRIADGQQKFTAAYDAVKKTLNEEIGEITNLLGSLKEA